MRLRYDQEAEEKLLDSKYLIKDFPHRINAETVIELGMGKGEMITGLAMRNKDIQYIGVEKYGTVAQKANRKAQELELNNFRIICEDIKNLQDIFVGKTNSVWLTFSDPWPKKRHAKRRLTHSSFLNLYKKILSDDGVLYFKTDNDGLFDFTIEELNSINAKIIFQTRDLHKSEKQANNVMTGYEKKWSEKGKNINYLEAKLGNI